MAKQKCFSALTLTAITAKEQIDLEFASSKGELMAVITPHSGKSVVPVTEWVS